MKRVSIVFSKAEYNEVLKKIANQLELYNKYASNDLRSAYGKLVEKTPWKRMEITPLMDKWAIEVTGRPLDDKKGCIGTRYISKDIP